MCSPTKLFLGIKLLLTCCIFLVIHNPVMGEDHEKYSDKGPPIRCGTYFLDKDHTFTVQSTDYPKKYKEGNSCVWLFLGTPTCYPMLRCGNFSLQESYMCRDDYLALSDGFDKDGLGKRFCGYNSPDYSISQTSILLLTFHSDIHSHGSSGFDCTVSCSPDKSYTPDYPKPNYGAPYGFDGYYSNSYPTPYDSPGYASSPYGYGSYDYRSKRGAIRNRVNRSIPNTPNQVYRPAPNSRVYRAASYGGKINLRHYDPSFGGGNRYMQTPRVYNLGGRNVSKSYSSSTGNSHGSTSYSGRSKPDQEKYPKSNVTAYNPPEQVYTPKPYPKQPSYLQNTPSTYLTCDCGFKGPLVEKVYKFDYSAPNGHESTANAHAVSVDESDAEAERHQRSLADTYYSDHQKYDGNVTPGKYRWMGYLRCVTSPRGDALDASKLEVILNDYNWKTDDDTKTVENYVEKMNKHPFYRYQDHEYDVAVLRLKQAVNLIRRSEPMLRTVCLPPRKTYKTFAYDNTTIIGWGRIKNGKPEYDTLKEAYASVITNEKCSNEYPGKVTDRMICADKHSYGYYVHGKEDEHYHEEYYTCPDDRGSPLMKSEYSRYVQIGIFSYAKDCKKENSVEVDTRVTEVNDWIRMIAKDGAWCHELDNHYKASQYKK